MDLVLIAYFMGSPVPIVRNIAGGTSSAAALADAHAAFRRLVDAASYEPLAATIVGPAGVLDQYDARGCWHSERAGVSF